MVPPWFAPPLQARASSSAAKLHVKHEALRCPGALTSAPVRAYWLQSLERSGARSGAMFVTFPRRRLSAKGRLSVASNQRLLIPITAFAGILLSTAARVSPCHRA